MFYFRHAGFCIALIGSFALFAGQANGDLLFSITGFANNFGDPGDPALAPEVSAGETFLAEFLIDASAVDSDPSSDRGSYLDAIISSTITFSGGYTSQVDFAGGEVIIQQDIAGGAVFLNDPNDLGGILIGDLGNPFPSDELLDPGTQIVGDPLSLFTLTEPTGLIVSFSDQSEGPPAASGPIVLTVSSAIPEPSSVGVIMLAACGCLVRRRS